MSEQVRVAVVQAAPIPFDKAACVAKVTKLTKEAAERGAKIILFPEAFIPWFPRSMFFGSAVGKRTEEGRRDYRRLWEQAVDVPGEETQILGQAAAEAGAYLSVGIVERERATLYCSVVFFGPDGSYLGKHRKLKPTGGERIIWGEGDGSTLPVLDTPYGKIGCAICWENYMPLMRAYIYGKGATIYMAPTADARDTWQHSIRHIACEGRVFLLGCNHFLTKDMIPTDLATYNDLAGEPELMCRGGSAIVDPMGNYLAGPLFGEEGILVADLDLGRIAEARFDFDPAGHYARNDVFTLHVNERAQKGLICTKDEKP